MIFDSLWGKPEAMMSFISREASTSQYRYPNEQSMRTSDLSTRETKVWKDLSSLSDKLQMMSISESSLAPAETAVVPQVASSSSSSAAQEGGASDNKRVEGKEWFMVSDRVKAAAAPPKVDLRKLTTRELMKLGWVSTRTAAGGEAFSAGQLSSGTPSLANRQDGVSMIPGSTLAVLSPANVKMDAQNNGGGQFEANALAIAFGKPPGGVPIDPHEGYQYTHFHLPKEYERNVNSYNLQIVMDNVFRAGAWHVQEILPWTEWDPAYQYVMERWIFDSGVPQRASYESAQRMMTSRRTSESFGMLYWGIAQQSEMQFWRTRTGQLHWFLQKIQMKNAIVEAACMNVVVALLTCRRSAKNPAERRHQPYTRFDFERLIESEYRQIDCIKRNQHGLDYAGGKFKEAYERGNIPYKGTLTWILPDVINQYVVQTPERNIYMLNGIPKTRFDDPDAVGGVRNIARIRIARNFLVNQIHTRPINLQEEHVVVGQHGIVFSGGKDFDINHFQTSDLNYRFYCFDRDDFSEIKYVDIFRASCLYGVPKQRRADRNVNHKEFEITEEFGRRYFYNWRHQLGRVHGPDGKEVDKYDLISNIRTRRYHKEAKEFEPNTMTHNSHAHVLTVDGFYNDADTTQGNSTFFARIKQRMARVLSQDARALDAFNRDAKAARAHAGAAASPDLPANPSEELITTALKHFPLSTAHWFEWCMLYNVPTGLAFKWTQKDITLKTVCIIGCADIGRSLGATLVGKGMYLVGTTPKTGMISGTVTYHQNSVVTDPDKVHIMRAPFVTGYIEGGSDRCWTYEDRTTYRRWKNECGSGSRRHAADRFQFCTHRPEQTIFVEVLALGAEERLPAYSAASGRWSEDMVGFGAFSAADDNKWDYHTDTAMWYNELWGRKPSSCELYTQQQVYYNDMRPCDGDITHQAFQLFKCRDKEKCDYKFKIRDRGWLPENIQPGMREYIEGKKPLTTIAFHCQPASQIIELYSTKA